MPCASLTAQTSRQDSPPRQAQSSYADRQFPPPARDLSPVGTVLPDGANSAGTSPVPPSAQAGNLPPPAPPAADDDGRLLRASAKQLTRYSSLQAKIRHQITMYGQQMRGSGAYYQQGQGDQLQLRMEMKIPLGQQIASLQHVCDGRHLWMRKAMNAKVDLQRVDLLRVRTVAGPNWRPGWQQAMTGGLPRLLGSLADYFEFAEPRSMVWNEQTVWRLRGAVRKRFPDPKNAGDAPTHVEVILDQQSLFPYRINYFCAVEERDGQTEMKPLVVLEMYDVVIGDAIPPQRFVYQAENYRNTTDAFIANLAEPLQLGPVDEDN